MLEYVDGELVAARNHTGAELEGFKRTADIERGTYRLSTYVDVHGSEQ